MPDQPLLPVLEQLANLTTQCLAAISQDDWPLALHHLTERQPALDALAKQVPLPLTVTTHQAFSQWQAVENQLQQAMQGLSQQRSHLEQVFAQIQTARQQLVAYQLIPATPAESDDWQTHSLHNHQG
jgi:DNA repair ATPase RecN